MTGKLRFGLYPKYKLAIVIHLQKIYFVNYQVIMFGQDEFHIWINEMTINDGISTVGIPKLMITAINN